MREHEVQFKPASLLSGSLIETPLIMFWMVKEKLSECAKGMKREDESNDVNSTELKRNTLTQTTHSLCLLQSDPTNRFQNFEPMNL